MKNMKKVRVVVVVVGFACVRTQCSILHYSTAAIRFNSDHLKKCSSRNIIRIYHIRSSLVIFKYKNFVCTICHYLFATTVMLQLAAVFTQVEPNLPIEF